MSNLMPVPIIGYRNGGYAVISAIPTNCQVDGFPQYSVACADAEGNAVSWMANVVTYEVCICETHHETSEVRIHDADDSGCCANAKREKRYELSFYWGNYYHHPEVIDGDKYEPHQLAMFDAVNRAGIRADLLTKFRRQV